MLQRAGYLAALTPYPRAIVGHCAGSSSQERCSAEPAFFQCTPPCLSAQRWVKAGGVREHMVHVINHREMYPFLHNGGVDRSLS